MVDEWLEGKSDGPESDQQGDWSAGGLELKREKPTPRPFKRIHLPFWVQLAVRGLKTRKSLFCSSEHLFSCVGGILVPDFKHHLTPNTMAKQSAEESAQEKLQDARKRNLDLAISHIQKEFGEAAIMRLGDESRCDVDVIPTGNLLIDRALGVGGFPRGRIVEVFGPESSGKTTLTLTAIAQAQKRGGLAAFIDVEHALDPQYARKLGVNLDDLLVSQPSSGEEALQICEALVRSNAIDVVVLDSVAALVTKQELDGEIGDSTVGAQARLMSAAMRKLTALISKANTVCIFTNQIREKIGVMFGNPETTPGGRALKFFSSVRVDIRRIGQIKATDGTVTGNRTKIKVVKNKVAPPFTEAEFDIMYNEGISSTGSLLDLALELEIVLKRGSWFSYNGNQMAQGRDAAKELLKGDPALYEEIATKVNEALESKKKK
jgi:recombination protein RecA